MTKFISKTYPGVINAESKPSFRHSETLRTAVSASNKKGFTLIELLVVVLIIGILASVALPQYQLSVEKARYTEAMTVANAIYKAQRAYYMANGDRAYNMEDLDISFPGVEINGSRVILPNVTCNLNAGAPESGLPWTGASVMCYTNQNATQYRRYYADTYPPMCLATKTYSLANRVCKTLSNQEPFSWDGGTNYYYIR